MGTNTGLIALSVAVLVLVAWNKKSSERIKKLEQQVNAPQV